MSFGVSRAALLRPSICTPARRLQSSSNLLSSMHRGAPIDIHPEVEDALATNKPVVALESTIITHGMPQPTNLQTARSVESIVRSTGSIPATIGIVGGRVKIGLTLSELEYLADIRSHTSIVKISRRDIAPAIAHKSDGGTTCSATLIFAALSGIKVFATGGLGGVHRGGERSMDVSADLHELTRCPVGLVSAGVKSILDIGRTLEYLETLGVPVISYAKTYDFPAFYTARSGFKTPWRVDDPETAARMLYTQWQLGMENGALFGVPIPEQFESIGQTLQEAVEVALAEAELNGVSKRGKEATPWLLNRVGELTKGTSLASNIALIENTALVGGRIAMQYAKLLSSGENENNANTPFIPSNDPVYPKFTPVAESTENEMNHGIYPALAKLIVIGSAAVDISSRAKDILPADTTLGPHSTSPGTVSITLGGVGRNVAEAAHRILTSHSSGQDTSTKLISVIGDDSFGRLISDEMRLIGMRTDGLVREPSKRSAVCNMLLDSAGGLIGGVADMDAIRSLIGETVTDILKSHSPNIVALDGNLSSDTLKHVVDYCNKNQIDTLFEPTSVTKSTGILSAVASSLGTTLPSRSPITYASPNRLELAQMYHACRSEPLNLTSHDIWWQVIDDFGISSQFRMELERLGRRNVDDDDVSKGTLSFLLKDGVAQMAINLLPFFQNIVIKCGEQGLLVVMRISGTDIASSGWDKEYTNVHGRRIVAHGKSSKETVVIQHFAPHALLKDDIRNVTGAGDTLVGSILASVSRDRNAFQNPLRLVETVHVAQKAAVLTLQSHQAVSRHLSLKGSL